MLKVIISLYRILNSFIINIQYKLFVFRSNKFRNCRIPKSARIGKKSSLRDVAIGYGSYLSNNAQISFAVIGKFCSIGPNFVCGFGIHPTDGISTSPSFYSTNKQNGITFSASDKIIERKKVIIGNYVFVGANVTVLDGVTIGDGAIIGAGAVVSKDIPPYAIAIGCPIRIEKYRFSSIIITKLLEIKWWDKDQWFWKKVEENFYDVNNFIRECSEK